MNELIVRFGEGSLTDLRGLGVLLASICLICLMMVVFADTGD